MANGFHTEIHIEIWPVKMAGGGFLHVENVPHGNIFEPWEMLIGKKHLLLASEHPDSVC